MVFLANFLKWEVIVLKERFFIDFTNFLNQYNLLDILKKIWH